MNDKVIVKLPSWSMNTVMNKIIELTRHTVAQDDLWIKSFVPCALFYFTLLVRYYEYAY